MRKTVFIFVMIYLILGCFTAYAVDPVGEGGSYVPKQEGKEENIGTDEAIAKTSIGNVYQEKRQQLSWPGEQQGLDPARIADGTWQLQGQVQTVAGVMPYFATETWKCDAKRGILYVNGWMWKGKIAGNYLQVQTQIETGAQAMLTIQFISNNEANCSLNVGATPTLSPCMGQYRATRVQ